TRAVTSDFSIHKRENMRRIHARETLRLSKECRSSSKPRALDALSAIADLEGRPQLRKKPPRERMRFRLGASPVRSVYDLRHSRTNRITGREKRRGQLGRRSSISKPRSAIIRWVSLASCPAVVK